MKNFGMFGSRGNVNLNQSETKYLTNFSFAGIGLGIVIILNLILIGLIYWGLEASDVGVLICIILLGMIQIVWTGISLYVVRGFIREDAFDWTSQAVSYIPQILNGSGPMVQNAMSAVKEGRAEAMHYATLIGELERLQTILQNQTAPIEAAPARAPIPGLPGSDNVTFTPFIDGE